MRGSGRSPFGAGAVLVALAAGALAVALASGGLSALRGRLESPETGVRRALAALGPGGPMDVGAGGATLQLTRLRLREPWVTPREGGARVVAAADAEGILSLDGRRVEVSAVGVERLAVVRCPGTGWCVEGPSTPRLASLLATLVRRAEGLRDGDAAAWRPLVAEDYGGREGGGEALLRGLAADLAGAARVAYRPIAWQIRLERETAQVGEDYAIAVGAGPPRHLRARLDLREEGGRWRFTGGL